MKLASRISALARRIGHEVKNKINANHPGVARAWVCFGYVGKHIVVRASHNVSSVSRTAAGRYRVTFAIPLPDSHYCWTALARSSTNTRSHRIAIVRSTYDEKTDHYVDISCATAACTFSDSTEINLTVFR